MKVQRLPSMIAIPFQEYLSESNAVFRLYRLCDAGEVLARFLTIVALSELRRQLGENPFPDKLLRVLNTRIKRPTFGQWRDMLLDLTEAVDWEKALLRLPFQQFVTKCLAPTLRGKEGLVEFRNNLIHAGPPAQAWAEQKLERWEPRLSGLIQHLSFLEPSRVVFFSQGTAWQLVGPTLKGEKITLSPALARELQGLPDRVVLVKDKAWLDLWPLCDYGRAMVSSPEGSRQAAHASPLVYFRAEPARCLYAALGGELPHGERSDVLEEFSALFRLKERFALEGPSLDFEEEIRADAAALIGKVRLQQVEQAKNTIQSVQRGIFWLTGPGGIGKSYLIAKLADDLRLPPLQGCRIAWRFKLSDRTRSNRTAFFQHTYGKLSAWLQKEERTSTTDPVKLFELVRELLDEVAVLKPGKPGGRPPRVLFFLDGMDEIGRLDESFLEIPFALSRDNVVWVCAGRPEGRLPQVFAPATPLIHNGLPAMENNDIRGLLLESSLSRKYDLLALDKEQGEETKNAAVEAVVQRAQGLPLYVHYVIQDILTGHFRFEDLPHRLPPRLRDYYEDLLGRQPINDLQPLLTPLMLTIAWAHAPLDETSLLYLMNRRGILEEDEADLLRQGLAALSSMVRQAPLPGTQDCGYEPYHPTFREHLRDDLAGNRTRENRRARKMFVELARDWAGLPQEHPIRAYVLSFGLKLLVEAQGWDDLEALLTDPHFIEAREATGPSHELMADYALALQAMPEPNWSRLWLAPGRCSLLTLKGISYLMDYGKVKEGIDLLQRCKEIVLARDLPELTCDWNILAGRVDLYHGNEHKALNRLKAALQIARQAGYEEGIAKIYLTLGVVRRKMDIPWQDAQKALENALDSDFAKNCPDFRMRVHLNLAMAFCRQGRPELARVSLEEVRGRLAKEPQPLITAWLLKYEGFACLTECDYPSALNCFRGAQEIFQSVGHVEEVNRCRALLLFSESLERIISREDPLFVDISQIPDSLQPLLRDLIPTIMLHKSMDTWILKIIDLLEKQTDPEPLVWRSV